MEIFYIKAVINIIGMLVGAFVIYLGYRLYLKSVVEKGKVEAEFENWKLALKGYGPGVVFAVAGAALVVFTLSRGFEYSEARKTTTTTTTPVETSQAAGQAQLDAVSSAEAATVTTETVEEFELDAEAAADEM